MADISDLLKSKKAQKILGQAKAPPKRRPWTVMSDQSPTELSDVAKPPTYSDSLSPNSTTPLSKIEDPQAFGNQLVSKEESIGKQLVSKGISSTARARNTESLIGKQLVSKSESPEEKHTFDFIEDSIPTPLINSKQLVSKNNVTSSLALERSSLNSNQLVSKQEAIGKQEIEPRVTNDDDQRRTQTNEPKREAQREATRKQLVSKAESISKQDLPFFDFHCVAELDLKILIYLFEQCQKNGARKTPPLKKADVSFAVGTTAKTVKTQIHRLVGRGFLQRGTTKSGRGGWAIYILPDQVFERLSIFAQQSQVIAFKTDQLTTISKQLVSKLEAQREAQREATPSSSSSSEINLTSTPTKDLNHNELPEDWKEVDFASLSKIGFSENHVRQVYTRGLLTAAQLQDSIAHFEFDMNHNNRLQTVRTHPLSFFMGIVGRGKLYVCPNFVSEQDKLLEQYLAQKKAQAEKRAEVIHEIKVLEYANWKSSLTPNELLSLVPESPFAKLGSAAYEGHIRAYFDESVWPVKRSSLQIE